MCGKKFTGRASQLYCGGTCKTRAYRSRKRQGSETKSNAITPGVREDLNFIRQFSESAYGTLLNIRAAHGRAPFDDALEAVYKAVKDTANSFFSS